MGFQEGLGATVELCGGLLCVKGSVCGGGGCGWWYTCPSKLSYHCVTKLKSVFCLEKAFT